MSARATTSPIRTEWPHGIITRELDQLESKVGNDQGPPFEENFSTYLARETDTDRRDYAILLRIEHAVLAGQQLPTSSEPFCSMLERRAGSPRVVEAHVRLLLLKRDVTSAKTIFQKNISLFRERAAADFLQGLLLQAEDNIDAWRSAMIEVLKKEPYHRAAIVQLAVREITTGEPSGVLPSVEAYLGREPQDTVVRAMYFALLKRHGFNDAASDQQAILSFVKPEWKLTG